MGRGYPRATLGPLTAKTTNIVCPGLRIRDPRHLGTEELSRMEKDNPPQLVTPASVKAIISRIEAAQLTRAQEDISTQLSDILDNVNFVINRFQEELGYDLKEKMKSHETEQKGKKRFILLEKIASFSKDAKMKEKHLYEILHWLGDWGDSLTYELRNRKSEEEQESLDEWIEVMEKVLPLSLTATKGGIQSLISLCSTLIEEQKKRAQISKCTFWQGWQEKSQQKSSIHPQPLSPEQMLQDKHTTCTKVSEVKSMLQELLDSTMFNKGEVKAIRYMSTVVENLNKALILQQKENRSLESKYRYLQIEMTKELSSQRLHFQKSIQVLESKRDALLKQVEVLGAKYHDLLLIKHALEFQLKKVQTSRGSTGDPAEVYIYSPGTHEKETLPKKEIVIEETQQEPKEEELLFSTVSPSSMVIAWDRGAMPSACQLRSTTDTHLRIADVFSKDTESLEPELPPSVDYKFPTKWERLVAEDPGHEDKDQEDHFQEKEGVQTKFQLRKHHLFPGSSRKVPLESQVEHWEEEMSWERQRQQWLQEEEMWQQRQRQWVLLEQEHQEKLRQWEMEAAARQGQQRLAPQEENKKSLRREEPREDAEKPIFTAISWWKNLEKAEALPVPPPSRVQSACPGRKPRFTRSPHAQHPKSLNQRTVSSVEFTQLSQAPKVSTKPKKSTSLPITGTFIRRVTRPSLQRSPVILKDKIYHMKMEAQKKNLQLLDGDSMLPCYLRSKALELTTTTMELSTRRLQCLCHKYILYRRFQNLRQEVINHIEDLRETRATYKTQSLYVFLENINRQQRLRLQAWTDKQKDLEVKRRECLSSMVTMFPKLRMEWNIHLNIPVVTSPKSRKCKSPSVLPWGIHSNSPACQQPLPSKYQECVPLQMASQQGNQIEAIWKTNVASSSHPIEKKTPVSLSWDQLGGYPDIPRLLALDMPSSHHRSVMSSKTW
ncbi:Protein FAM186B [Sciurus carolinensis]|uniref:Protein FAM186B n=1 Tax=Sciurus carolinensis TaxID=30640 RepID=A0AA41MVY4_SCICA|nr:Protein FAM186B [Sciurus carolinensis]